MDRTVIPVDCARLLTQLAHLWQRNNACQEPPQPLTIDSEIKEVLEQLVRIVSAEMKAPAWPTETLPPAPDAPLLKLTRRERDVLNWLAKGKSVDDVGNLMQISKCTVRTYIQRSLRKLDVSNRTHAVTRALRFGLIDL